MKTIREMLESEDYESYIDSKLGNNLYINDPERAERISAYAERSADGSTHAEVIEDWRDYIASCDLSEEEKESILKEIDEVEARHEAAGTLNDIIG